LLQSGIFSGLTLGLFGLSQLQLEVEVESGFQAANIVLELRKDANFLLSTLLWGNVSINVLLTLLTESALTGMWSFFLSSISITILGEIFPQAYFSRNALKMGIRLAPLVRIYQVLLFPVAKPTALLLDQWLGKEGVRYLDEEDFCVMLKKHIDSQDSDIGALEGTGALNFLSLDDLKVTEEGELINPKSIIQMETEHKLPVFPQFQRVAEDPFLQQIEESKEKWVILTDEYGEPTLVLDADAFLREALFCTGPFRPYAYCHRPLVVHDPELHLGSILHRLKVDPEHREDDVIDKDIILCWSSEKRILTGADILGRLLRGIVRRDKMSF